MMFKSCNWHISKIRSLNNSLTQGFVLLYFLIVSIHPFVIPSVYAAVQESLLPFGRKP